jgi:septal ring factor EnvC (AmiA/AmiB activator)
VTFHYKSDHTNTPQFGLIAEEVAEVNPDLVVRDKNGEIYTVRYEQVNAMVLNEFLKEHKRVEAQQATIAELKSTVAQQRADFETATAQQHKQIEALAASVKEQAAQIQRVSVQIELNRPATQQVALNIP